MYAAILVSNIPIRCIHRYIACTLLGRRNKHVMIDDCVAIALVVHEETSQ